MNDAEEIKKRIDIVELVGQYLQLKKAGINHSACCPFHEEKTPSFMVSSQRQSYKCFGCGKSGDVISFFMEMEGFSFLEAIKILGERVGVEVSTKPKQEIERERTIRDKIFAVNLIAAKYFKSVLWGKEGGGALEYLTKRKVSNSMIEKFKLGYAPQSSRLPEYFQKYKFENSHIALAGNPQRFKYRIIFPIFDVMGGVIGFSGRILQSDLPDGVSPHPKYLNSPETPIFHKSRCLYGLNFAKEKIRKNNRVIVVEGQMDVISSHVAGVEEVVASSGTALTREHLKILKRYTNNIIFAFDEDGAGQKAAYSAILMAIEEDLDAKLTIIEKFKDVGELVENEPEAWQKTVNGALAPIEWLIEKTKRESSVLGPMQKKKLSSLCLPIIRVMSNEVEKSHYISHLAHFLGVPVLSIDKALSKISAPPVPKQDQVTSELKRNLEIDIFAFVLTYPKLCQKVDELKDSAITNDVLSGFYNDAYKCYDAKDDIPSCLSKVSISLSDDIRQAVAVSALEWDGKIAESEEGALLEFRDILKKLKSNKRDLIKDEFARRIGEAEARGDTDLVRSLMKDLQENLRKK